MSVSSGHPEAVVLERARSGLPPSRPKRLVNQVLAGVQVIEDLGAQHVAATVHRGARPPRCRARRTRGHPATSARRGMSTADGRSSVATASLARASSTMPIERCVGERVAVVGQEQLLAREMVVHPAQPLADRGVEPGVGEGDPPVLDVAAQQLDLAAAVGQHEVVRQRLLVAQEVVLDRVGPVAQAEDELAVPEVGVVAHDVPQDRPVADRHHRLGDRLGLLAQADAPSPAEQHDLHAFDRSPTRGMGTTSRAPHSRAYPTDWRSRSAGSTAGSGSPPASSRPAARADGSGYASPA